MQATVARRAMFNAAHRLHVATWSDAQNIETFGPCNNVNYHGHNYALTAKVTGEIDPVTGYVIDIKTLKDIIETEVVQRYDHRNLNLDCPDFLTTNPTAENIAVAIYGHIKKHLPPNLTLTITLHETDRNYVEYNGN